MAHGTVLAGNRRLMEESGVDEVVDELMNTLQKLMK